MEKTGLFYLYNSIIGRFVLKILVNPYISYICGIFLDSPLSVLLIKPFISKNNINIDEYESVKYKSFNEFFSRKIKPGKRVISDNPNEFISPCDAYLSCYKLNEQTVIPAKQSEYNLHSLLRDKKLATEFENGWCLVFRLCVDHYHRYIYTDNGRILCKRKIKGVLHTVRPVALRARPVFVENTREYMLLDTENFGRIIQMEVGAMLVGKIENFDEKGSFVRGAEKGRFLYGGSTIIMLVKEDKICIDAGLVNAGKDGKEISVKMGQNLGSVL